MPLLFCLLLCLLFCLSYFAYPFAYSFAYSIKLSNRNQSTSVFDLLENYPLSNAQSRVDQSDFWNYLTTKYSLEKKELLGGGGVVGEDRYLIFWGNFFGLSVFSFIILYLVCVLSILLCHRITRIKKGTLDIIHFHTCKLSFSTQEFDTAW